MTCHYLLYTILLQLTIKYTNLILVQGAQTAQFDLKWVRPEACAMKQDSGLLT